MAYFDFTSGQPLLASQLDSAFGNGGWTSYTPTFANFTLGNGTISAAYVQIGKTVLVRVKVTLGSTSSMGSAPTVSLPVTGQASGLLFSAYLADASATDFVGNAYIASSTTVGIRMINVSATYATTASVSAAAPFTWTTNDSFSFAIEYEAS